MDGTKMVGLYTAVLYINGGKIGSLLTRRAICMGGPLVDGNDSSIECLLFQAYQKYAQRLGCIYSEIRPILEPVAQAYTAYGYNREDHFNLTIDISRSIEVLYEGLHKERRRNIAQAEKKGLTFRELTSDEEIIAFSEIIKKTYQRKQVPIAYLDIFKYAKVQCGEYIHFFGAFLEDKMVSGQVRLYYKDLVYAWFAGSDEQYFKYRPNDFLTWNVLLWSKEHGYSVFDFGGGGKPNVPYGVRDYKMKYGCEQYNYGRFKSVHKPVLYKIGEIGYSLIHRSK